MDTKSDTHADPKASHATRRTKPNGQNSAHENGSSPPGHTEDPPPKQTGGVTPVATVQDKNRFRRSLCNVKKPIQYGDALDSQFAALLGQYLAPYGFFERNARCVELEYDYKLGAFQLTPADPYGFCTDLETVCSPYFMKEVVNKKTGDKEWVRKFRSIPLILSRTVLASKDFLEQLRPLLGFAAMRVPVRRSSSEIELLAEGYDEKSGILTVSTPSANYGKAALDFTLESATAFFRELLSEFCFYEQDKDRASSVALSGMLTLFCRELLGSRTQKPAFIYAANAEGAGKTLLAKLAIISHLGYCPTGTVPDDEDEFRKRIFSNTLADMPVLFLDNVKGYLSSGALEAFLTSSIVSDRVLGASRVLNLEHNSVVFITGNAATYSADLRRRSLTIELFLQEMKSEDRPILHPLDDSAINDKRTEILAALWTLVKSWIEAGEPKPEVYHPSFRRWSEIIAGILEHAGFASPCDDPFTELSGDQDTKDMIRLVDLMNPGRQFKYDELVGFCQDYNLFAGLVPDKGEQDPAQRSKFGKLLRRYRERILNKAFKFQILGHSRDTQRFVVQDLTPK